MPRRLSDDVNELRINDHISGSTIVLYYRMPTSEEMIQYTNEMTQRRKNKIVLRIGETRQKFGARILMGFRDGDFESNKDGQYVPMASNPKSENYFPDWKEHIKKHAPDIIEALAMHVFDASTEESSEGEDVEED